MSVSKIVAAAASGVGGAGLDVDEVFNTHLYTGTGSAIPVNNGIDMSGEGGLVWIKGRNSTRSHLLYDTERGTSKALAIQTDAQFDIANAVTAFNNNGYTIGTYDDVNSSDANKTQVAWAFRKAPKFFDCISIDVADPEPTTVTVNHNLGQQVGMVIMKPYLHTYPWYVWHSSLNANKNLELNTTAAESSFGGTGFSSTSTTITIPGSFVHSGSSNGKCMLYLFAHNNNDGEFGPDADQDIIKCGSYTGNNSTNGPTINLGFEPQWLLLRHLDANGNSWLILDNMRGVSTGGNDAYLRPNASGDEQSGADLVEFNSTGFQLKRANDDVNGNGNSYIYMAIRRGPLAAPTDATKVFSVQTKTNDPTAYDSGFPVDMALRRNSRSGTGDNEIGTRLLGTSKGYTNESDVFDSDHPEFRWDFMGGWNSNASLTTNSISWMWKRAPSYFDVVHYNTSSYPISVPHSLTVTPEMIWYKDREHASSWAVWHKDVTGYLYLNADNAVNTYTGLFGTHTATNVIFDNLETGNNCIAYLFATLDGISKVGSYTGNATDNHVIDCGFSSGARFVLIKKSSNPGEWFVVDTVRGIVSGADPFLELNQNRAEITNDDIVDPNSSGFALSSRADCNANGQTYIFYAIA